MPESATISGRSPVGHSPGVQRGLGWVLLIQGIVLIVLAFLLTSANFPFTRIRLESSVILAIGALATAAALAYRRFSVETVLTLTVILAVLTGAFGLGYKGPASGDIAYGLTHIQPRVLLPGGSWVEGWPTYDRHLGMLMAPGSSFRNHSADFDVTYHTGPDGFRRLPDPVVSHPDGEIWFFGSSFTFGAGVEDDETYVYRLAQAWPESRVRSFSLPGYSTTNSYLHLQDQLSRGIVPSAVVYNWTDDLPKRNYLRRSWFRRANVEFIPRFELENGQLRFLGIVPGSEANLEDGPTLDETEYRLTEALIRGMARMCRERHIPFVMLLLWGADDRVPSAVLDEPGLHELDVRAVSDSYFQHDGHPTRIWHQAVAQAIAAHPLLADLTGNRKLQTAIAFSPSSVPAWRLWTDGPDPVAVLDIPTDDRGPVALKMSPAAAKTLPWQIQLKYRVSLRKDHDYLLEAEVRSKEPRSITYSIQQNHAPYDNLAPAADLKLSPDWLTIQRHFTVDRDEPDAQIVIAAGASKSSMEIRTTRVLEDGKDLSGPKPALLLTPKARGQETPE